MFSTTFRFALLTVLAAAALDAESGRDAWLRYAPLDEPALTQARAGVPAVITAAGDSPVVTSARDEVLRGVHGMLGRTLRAESGLPREDAIVIGTVDSLRAGAPSLDPGGPLPADAFRIRTVTVGSLHYTLIAGGNANGTLYGVFEYLRKVALGAPLTSLNDEQAPYAPVRWVNEWDRLDGSIERGYGGNSIFFENGKVREDLTRAAEYARLLASLGINACSINNVNADPKVLAPDFVPQLARVAAAFHPWGVRLAIAVDFGSPKSVGGLDTFDPLDEKVAAWWKARADAIYQAIPDFAGIVLKADSEGRVGPSTYNRSHADAANVVARALEPHGGLLFYRGFVYDHHMDWRNPKNDRGRAAYDNFKPLDGKFDANVAVQIKNGPIDFQVREPASPLFGALEQTSQAVELQITQEYFGQARHLVYLAPYWKETLDFDMRAKGAGTPVKALVAGKVFHRPTGGFVGVSNVGLDDNWTGNHFSQANLYAFGRLAWNPDLSSERIANEWTRLTFGSNPKVVETVTGMLMQSWPMYEQYTGPLGLQTLTEITGTHFGPAVEASERNGWGQWHNADEKGVGMDRTIATGTGYIGQYRSDVARVFESLATCPDDILLFMHHVPYTYKLHSGKTVIQYIYDSHYEGAATAADFVRRWKSIQPFVDNRRYAEALAQLQFQAGHAEEWRDSVVSWFLKTSAIADAKDRAGHYPGRVEAESMQLTGYVQTEARPWETASGGLAVSCPAPAQQCSAAMKFAGAPGWYTIRVRYFDLPIGVAHFTVLVGAQTVAEWDADDHLPARKIDGSSSTLRVLNGIALRPGDEIRIEGTPGGNDRAAFDYIEVSTDDGKSVR
jgi:alpha-glucuronidase